MVRQFSVIAAVVVPLALSACGSDPKPPPKKPVVEQEEKKPPPVETETDREKKRRAAAHAIIPEGSACLPLALKGDSGPRLELGTIDGGAVVCAVDVDKERLLGPVGCWNIALESGALAYQAPAPLPGRSVSIALSDRCARAYCLPKDAKTPASKVVHMATNGDGTKVAVLAGDDLHLFDAASKAHESSFSIRGDKGVTNDPSAVHWIADVLFVEGSDQGPYSAVWAFKKDGTQVGAIEAIGSKDGKPLSTHGGSFSLLDSTHVAIAEQGYSAMTIYEVDTGKRSKLVRKLAKPPCKADELDAFWTDNDGAVGAKCKEHMRKSFGSLIGATAIAGKKNFLVLLRGDRLGELSVMDKKTLAENRVLKMPWCEAGVAAAPTMNETDALKPKKDAQDAKSGPKTRAPVKKGGDEDRDAGGE